MQEQNENYFSALPNGIKVVWLKGMARKPKKRRVGRPNVENARRVRVQVVVSSHDLDAIDTLRGRETRSTWIYRLIEQALIVL